MDPGELVVLSGYEDANITYNVSPMYHRAFGDGGIDKLKGMRGVDAEPLLNAAIAAMRREPEAYKLLNPPNGWGNYEGALRILETLVGWCRGVPEAQIRIT